MCHGVCSLFNPVSPSSSAHSCGDTDPGKSPLFAYTKIGMPELFTCKSLETTTRKWSERTRHEKRGHLFTVLEDNNLKSTNVRLINHRSIHSRSDCFVGVQDGITNPLPGLGAHHSKIFGALLTYPLNVFVACTIYSAYCQFD